MQGASKDAADPMSGLGLAALRLPAWLPVWIGAAFPLAVGLAHGIDRPFIITPDADLIYMGEVLRGLDHRPYGYTDHPGYTYTLLLAGWMKLLSWVGAIPRPGLGEAIAAPSIEAYMQAMIWAGRLFSALCAGALVAVSAWLVRRSGASSLAAGLFALLLGTSAGIAHQAVILRAELLSGGLAFASFCCLAIAARRSGWPAMGWLASAGLFAVLAMHAKVQVIFLLLAFPALALLLDALQGKRPPGMADWRTLPVVVVLAALVVPAAVITAISVTAFGGGRPYQVLIAAWVAAGMIAFARRNRVPTIVALIAGLALAGGMALGFGLTLLRPAPRVIDAVVNPIEHMMVFSSVAQAGGLGSLPAIVARFFTSASLFADHLIPLRAIEGLALLGAVLCYRTGNRRRALLAAGLLATALAVEAMFHLRGVFPFYLIYLEPWALFALLLAADATPQRRAVLAVAVVLIGWQGVRAFEPGVVPRQPVQNVCYQADTYLEPELAERFHPLCAR